jgi:hypothetical protein
MFIEIRTSMQKYIVYVEPPLSLWNMLCEWKPYMIGLTDVE